MNAGSSDSSSTPQDIVHLAIETTGRLGSVAVLRGSEVLRKINLDPSRRTASTLAPELEQTFQWCDQTNQPLQFVSVADGPGSFTGLRIGVTTAKTLSYALNFPLVAVDSLASIAAAAFHRMDEVKSVWAVLDAYRSQVFVGQFTRESLLPPVDAVPKSWSAHPACVSVMSQQEWGELCSSRPAENFLTGDKKPLGKWADEAVARECDAIGVGLLAIRAAAVNDFVDPMGLVPRYLKVSAAEEKLATAELKPPHEAGL